MKKPCKECPYRKDSLPGYLGEASYDPVIFLHQIDAPNVHPCHLSVDWEKETDLTNKPVCVGALIFMNNSCKRHRSPLVAAMQNEAGKSDEVFSFNHNFINHHS